MPDEPTRQPIPVAVSLWYTIHRNEITDWADVYPAILLPHAQRAQRIFHPQLGTGSIVGHAVNQDGVQQLIDYDSGARQRQPIYNVLSLS